MRIDMLIGNHLSASKGYAAMGKAALALDANTFAFFTRNPRGGKAKEIDEKDVEKFLNFAKEHEFGKIVAHAPYTMNLCAAKEDVRSFSKEMLLDDLNAWSIHRTIIIIFIRVPMWDKGRKKGSH